jgi:hypothetical protein
VFVFERGEAKRASSSRPKELPMTARAFDRIHKIEKMRSFPSLPYFL